MRRATDDIKATVREDTISIHALHEESDLHDASNDELLQISIHALHEESDLHVGLVAYQPVISIHALHEESDSA